jgi:NADH-quinone oxidoreductase subunit J
MASDIRDKAPKMAVFFVFTFLFTMMIGSPIWQVSPIYPIIPGPPFMISDIGIEVFTTFVLPFEVISLILLAAMIGGIFLAKKEAVS